MRRLLRKKIKSRKKVKPDFSVDALNSSGLINYDVLRDQHLIRFFDQKETQKLLIKQGLLAKQVKKVAFTK